MRTIIQQLEDLKEWAQNPERYERRLAFRSNLPSTEAGTIPPEFDELSDREVEYYKTGPWSTREDYRKGQLVQPGPGRQGYAESPDAKKIEKGIYQRVNKNYRIKANRAGVMLDKTLAKGSTIEDARKVLSDWEAAHPIDVKWKKGQKIKLISKGQKGKQITTDILYRTPKIKADFKTALIDFAGENKGNWNKAKFQDTFGGIVEDAMQFVREQNPELIRDWDAVQTKKYRTHLDDLGIKDWASANKKQRQVIMTKAYRVVNPYERTGYSVARDQIAKNIPVLNKFEKSGQTLRYFYDIVKDRTFKKNLRAYLNGTAGEYVTEAFDQAGIKTKYKNILPKIKDHLEVWHLYENPGTAYKGQLKKEKIKKWSDLHTENMINTAKRVSLTDYKNQLDLAHRQDLVIDQNISELGIEKGEINRVLIKDAELERNKLHRKNFELVDEIKKGNNVEKNLRLINENNARITKIAELTKGRLTGITINPDTLEAIKLKPSNIMGVDAGILNKSMKDLTVADKKVLKTQILPQMIEEARAMTPQKIAADLKGIMDDPVLSEKLATTMKKLKVKPGTPITQHIFDQSHEVYNLMKQSLVSQIRTMDGKTLAQYKKFYPKCFEQDVGGNALRCLTKQVEKNSEKFVKNSVSIAKAAEGTKEGSQIFRMLNKMKPLLRGTGWLAAGEALFAPLFMLGPYAKGKTWKRSISDALYGLNVPKWLGGWAQSEAAEIRENAGQEGYDVWRMKQIDAKRDELIAEYNDLMQDQTTEYPTIESLQRSAVIQEKVNQLAKEWDDLSQQFLSGEFNEKGNPIGNENFVRALNALLAAEGREADPEKGITAVEGQIQKFDKQRVGERQQRWQKVGRTLIDKPTDAFIDFTLGPNWKENLPEQQNQFYKKRYPRNPTELGQHLSYDPDIPMFAEGGIASIRRPWAIPPESGPDPQGLASLNNYATKRTE